VIEEKSSREKLPFDAINAGVSGDTTAGGLGAVGLWWQKNRRAVLALGANDGLLGLPMAQTKANLQAIIDRVKAKNPTVKIVIAGCRFRRTWAAIMARRSGPSSPISRGANDAALVPFPRRCGWPR
jgi:acyl-CoA thioesterase-1